MMKPPTTGLDQGHTADTSAPAPGGLRGGLRRWTQQEDLNFLLTNRIPRIAVTRFMGWFSRIRSPWLARLAIAVWRQFTDLDLSDAQTQRFDSLHACFTRALRPGARPICSDPSMLCSPSDAIVGACGEISGTQVFQAKGMPYRLEDLLGNDPIAATLQGGRYVTLRLTSAMYHRFHAPDDGRLGDVTYFSGDTWNVNPIALKRVERLFCRNERALLPLTLADGHRIALVPVAAVLVASLRLHALDVLLHLRWRGPNHLPCDAPVTRGQELGWFQHGSTILVFVPRGFELAPGIEPGVHLRMGQALLQRPGPGSDTTVSSATTIMPGHAV